MLAVFLAPFLVVSLLYKFKRVRSELLLVAEAKEPVLFSGYSARLYIMILVLGLLDKKQMKQHKLRMRNSSVEVVPAKATL